MNEIIDITKRKNIKRLKDIPEGTFFKIIRNNDSRVLIKTDTKENTSIATYYNCTDAETGKNYCIWQEEDVVTYRATINIEEE